MSVSRPPWRRPSRQASATNRRRPGHAYSAPPRYVRQYSLQGTGDVVPFFNVFLDPRGASGPDSAGLFYTVDLKSTGMDHDAIAARAAASLEPPRSVSCMDANTCLSSLR